MNTLAVRYCQLHRIHVEDFASHLLRRSLYSRARWLHGLLALIPGYFTPDLELIAAIGRLEEGADFSGEVAEFLYHPANLGRLRHDWRLRLSVTRLQWIVEATQHGETEAVERLAAFPRGRAGAFHAHAAHA